MEGITGKLAKFVVKTSFDDLPEPVVHTTKLSGSGVAWFFS